MAGDKACKCSPEINFLNSMQLMLMEALADRDWDRAKHYLDVVKDSIDDVSKCAKVDLTPAKEYLEKTDEYINMREEGVRLTLRTLEDSFWHTLYNVCKKEF